MRKPLRQAFAVVVVLVVLASSTVRAGDAIATTGEDSWVPVPFRVRNLTFPAVLSLGFMPRPTDPVGAGNWALELNASVSNNFQMSAGVEEWLSARGGDRRPLSQSNATSIFAGLDEPQFLIDGEINVVDLGVHYGLTPRWTLSLRLGYLGYNGGFMDTFIQDFHDLVGIGQAGREFIGRGDFQVLFMNEEESLFMVERPSPGGFTDPTLSLTYSFPETWKGWSFSIEGAVKTPVAKVDDWLSTGSWDFGLQGTAEKKWRKNALILNLALVMPGDFEIEGTFDPPGLPSVNVAYLHRFGRRTTGIIQALYSENIFRDEVDSSLSAYEFQITAGVKIEALGGSIGIAFTENLFNFDNTPDFGLHLSYAILLD